MIVDCDIVNIFSYYVYIRVDVYRVNMVTFNIQMLSVHPSHSLRFLSFLHLPTLSLHLSSVCVCVCLWKVLLGDRQGESTDINDRRLHVEFAVMRL